MNYCVRVGNKIARGSVYLVKRIAAAAAVHLQVCHAALGGHLRWLKEQQKLF
jgi:hypothetical protein